MNNVGDPLTVRIGSEKVYLSSLCCIPQARRKCLSVSATLILKLTRICRIARNKRHPAMDSTPVRRSAKCVQDFHNPHFKPLWEPDTTIGRNAIKYSLVHHVYQQRISNAGLCGFCTDELTRRVSEVAGHLKAKGLFHDEKAFMDLFWQDADAEADGGVGVVAGETIVVLDKHGEKISVADHAEELAHEMSTAWWTERGLKFQSEIAAIDRLEAVGPRGPSLVGRLGRRDGGRSETTPWETRFMYALWTVTREDIVEEVSITSFLELQEKYLNFTHENC